MLHYFLDFPNTFGFGHQQIDATGLLLQRYLLAVSGLGFAPLPMSYWAAQQVGEFQPHGGRNSECNFHGQFIFGWVGHGYQLQPFSGVLGLGKSGRSAVDELDIDDPLVECSTAVPHRYGVLSLLRRGDWHAYRTH